MFFFLQQFAVSNHLVYGAESKFCHVFTQFLCDEPHEVFHVFRFAAETFSQLRILCCHADRTGIQVADTHHHTSHCNQRCGCETEFFCSKQCGDRYVTSAHQFSVCLNADFVSKSVHDQRLMGFCKSELPRKSGIVDGTSWCSSGTSVITGDQHDLCSCFCNTGCNRSDTCFRYQFYGNSRIFVCILQIVDQFCQILD